METIVELEIRAKLQMAISKDRRVPSGVPLVMVPESLIQEAIEVLQCCEKRDHLQNVAETKL